MHPGQLREEGANVTLMIQADMLAYRAFQEPPQIGIPDLSVLLGPFFCHTNF